MRLPHIWLSTVAAMALAGVVATTPAAAQTTSFRDTAKLTFTAPVQIPGHTLPAGEYVFMIADPSAARSVAQVWNADETELVAQALIVPTRRQDALGEPAVRFSNTPAGDAPALRAWFVPGESIGQAFVYPADQAVQIAKNARTFVLASDDDAPWARVDVATVYRVDEAGMKHTYAEPASWDDAPLMETATEADLPLMAPDAILDRIEAIVDHALESSMMNAVTIDRDQLETILVGVERLRAAMDDGREHR